ncbi:MAG TPA: spermidine synthase [Gammaproteobacteria bacterium]|nr:spermidine synthase [Gammaproteobacteria bacterium]
MLNQELKLNPPKAIYYVLFTVSGFSGLIYESIWSHYLKLFLGHAAYAQSLVLSIFMGGMAIGAWVAGQYSSRLRTPVLAYALVEGVIGILALIFHGSFTAIIDLAYNSLLPATGSIALAHAIKWTLGAAMIIPQSILLGMTFPLMTAGIVRRYPAGSGGTIALLYFTNSIGAAIGVLVSGFWLIEAVGLPGTITTAGIINILLALIVWMTIKLDIAPATAPMRAGPNAGANRENRLLLGAAFVTGLASFIYEIGWIRMLSLVLGSSTHAFELMLSAFITGLACGGLWIRKRIDNFPSPVKFAAQVQIAMGLLALLTLPLYGATFDWMSTLVRALNKTEQAYSLLLLASHGIALAIMLPATFCAGMTLPLFTHSLLKTGYGEKSIGRIYAFNTAGSIAGVLLAVNTLPLLGLKNLISLGAFLDIALGLALLAFIFGAGRRARLAGICAAVAAAFLAVFSFSHISPAQLASGVFRYGRAYIENGTEVYFYRDGKTSSVSVHGRPDMRVLSTNGKPDASINYNPRQSATSDENTMILAAALPYGFKPEIRTAAIIGLGSGLTTQTLLELSQMEQVDTVEIESAVIAASREFGDRVARAHTDPRSKIHVEDAKTFFSVNNRQYDLIASEPSNPWVSGVASLFTQEFYSQVKRYLVEDGIFTQWLHLYETNWRNIASVLKALDANFGDYAVYAANNLDILIIARKNGPLGMLQADRILNSDLHDTLGKLNIRTTADLNYRLLGTREILSPFLRSAPVPLNSDYFPYLDTRAHKAFFMERKSLEFRLNTLPLPVLEMLQPGEFYAARNLTAKEDLLIAKTARGARSLLGGLLQGAPPEDAPAAADPYVKDLSVLLLTASQCDKAAPAKLWLKNWHALGQFMLANLDSQSALSIWNAPAVKNCHARARPDLQQWLDFYRSIAQRNGAEMQRRARELLAKNAAGKDAELNNYLLGAALLGAYTDGQPRLVVETWKQYARLYRTIGEVPFYIRIIVQKAAAEL